MWIIGLIINNKRCLFVAPPEVLILKKAIRRKEVGSILQPGQVETFTKWYKRELAALRYIIYIETCRELNNAAFSLIKIKTSLRRYIGATTTI